MDEGETDHYILPTQKVVQSAPSKYNGEVRYYVSDVLENYSFDQAAS